MKKQIKNSFLKKKSTRQQQRQAWLKSPAKTKSILLVCNREDKSIKRRVEELFPSASVYLLHERDIKEDRAVGFYYTVHKSDFNLTGKLKNDKLTNLCQMQLDLLIDLSLENEQLNYFITHTKPALKVGNMNSPKADLYDVLLQFESSEIQNIDNIHEQISKLTQYADEQV